MGIFNIFNSVKGKDNLQNTPQSPATVPNAVNNGGALAATPDSATAYAPKAAISTKQVQEANAILRKYKDGKADLENRIIENEKWYKLRHWSVLREARSQIEPTSAWLFNCIENKHADAMDNYPSPNVLPREEADKGEAKMLSAILPVIFEQNDFEKTYSQVTKYKLKFGTGVYGIFWDTTLLNGMGDVSIKKIDLINLYWEPGVTDIQSSRNVFHVELCDNDLLEERYPELKGKLGSAYLDIGKYAYDEKIDTSSKSAVVDWYYKKYAGGRTVLHYVKYVNDTVLYASENDPKFADRGWYDHGLYPFEFDVLHEVEGTIAGLGWIDIGKNTQGFIDKGNQAIMKNMLSNSKPRYLYTDSLGINLDEYADTEKEFVRVEGSLSDTNIQPIQGKALNDIYVSVVLNAIDELKETTGNRDVSQGGTTGGVTAASAIAAQMEAGSKLSRTSNKSSYRTYKRICLQVIELIRQFYDIQRKFRIVGQNGMEEYISYSNAGISPMHQGNDFSIDMGYRVPLFDVSVSAQRQSPYSKMAQNELALQFYNAGFFNPQLGDQALACLDIMDFDRKDIVINTVRNNYMAYQQMMMMNMVSAAGQMSKAREIDEDNAEENEVLGGKESEPETVKKAKERTAEAATPV